ncbi:MAG: S41 family peptidase [Muribaculum sp.]|nr:S41 family peptidase [Muribaculum sp.]
MNTAKLLYTLLITVCCTITSCVSDDMPEWKDTQRGNFDMLWTILDQRYCFFEEKGVDWNEVYNRYLPKVSDKMTDRELFFVCADMLNELRDGHTNLISSFNTSYYRKWWSDYPANYSERLVEQYYFNFNYLSTGGIDYGILPQNVGYMRYGSFSMPVGESNLDQILLYFAPCDALIIDIRDNGGGDMTNVGTLVSRFISEKTLAGYILHKTGPGHNDFSEPYAYYYYPSPANRISWGKPVVVLTGRGTFSAANNFVSVMQYVPGVKIVGATTGGGSGMPFNSELINGWAVRFSACPVLDAHMLPTEFGIEPSPGCDIPFSPEAAIQGHDTVLDFAVTLITSGQ